MPTTKAQLLARMRAAPSNGASPARAPAAEQFTPGAPSAPSNIPLLSVASTALAGDTVPTTVTTDDGDGFTTTGVTLFDGASSLGAMAGGPTSWTKSIVGVTAGVHSLKGRRVTGSGSIDSIVHTLTVSGGGGSGAFDNSFDASFG